MAQLAIDTETGDLAQGPGGFYLVEGVEAIRQDLWLRLNTIRGELPYAVSVGVPMVEEVSARGTAPERVIAIYREVIVTTNGVTGFIVEPYGSYDPVNSVFRIGFTVSTQYGPLSFDGTLPVVVS